MIFPPKTLMLKIATLSRKFVGLHEQRPDGRTPFFPCIHLSIFLNPLSSSFILTTRKMPSSPSVSFTGCALLVVSHLTNHLAMPSSVRLWTLEPAKQQSYCLITRASLRSLLPWSVIFSVSEGLGWLKMQLIC